MWFCLKAMEIRIDQTKNIGRTEYDGVFWLSVRYKDTFEKEKQNSKRIIADRSCLVEKKIAVLGGATTNEVVEQLALFLLNEGIKTEFYQSEYGQYWQDAVFGTEELDSFSPDIIYIHTNWRNIEKFP